MKAETPEAARAGAALLIIDMINDLDFENGSELLPPALDAADAIERLRRQADAREQREGIPAANQLFVAAEQLLAEFGLSLGSRCPLQQHRRQIAGGIVQSGGEYVVVRDFSRTR